MRTIHEIIEEWKVNVLPGDADDWRTVCEKSMEIYAKEVIAEIQDNMWEYADVVEGHKGTPATTVDNKQKFEELLKAIK